MCNPLAMLAMQGSSAAASAVGAYAASASQKSSLKFQAQMAEISAKRAEVGAQQELARGQFEEQKARMGTAIVKSRQRAAFAANNVDLGVGSAARALASTAVMGEIDANNIKANATRAAWGLRTQAVDYKNQAGLSRASASAISPLMSGATSLLGGATDVASSFYSMGKEGAYSNPGAGNASLQKLYSNFFK